MRGGRSSSAPLHKTHKVSQGKSESEEYDTLGSDSDTEVGTSSRTESSNHLVDSHHSVSAADSRVHSMQIFHPSIFRLLSFLQIYISLSPSLQFRFNLISSFSKRKKRKRASSSGIGREKKKEIKRYKRKGNERRGGVLPSFFFFSMHHAVPDVRSPVACLYIYTYIYLYILFI